MEKINAAYIKTIYQKDDYIVAVYKSEKKNITVTGYNLPCLLYTSDAADE